MTNIKIDYINHRIDYLNSYIKELEKYKFKYDIELQKERIKIYELIKQDLKIIGLLIKWYDFITIKKDYEYLYNDEIFIFKNDMKLVENYLEHHLHYIPRCFNKEGDNHD